MLHVTTGASGRRRDDGARHMVGLVLAVAVAACATATTQPSFDFVGIAAQDGPPGGHPCSGSEIVGRLAVDQKWGLGVVDESSGRRHGTVWPPAFAAARQGGRIVLLDQNLRVVAHEGDVVVVPGE